jgi:hypothetical protein
MGYDCDNCTCCNCRCDRACWWCSDDNPSQKSAPNTVFTIPRRIAVCVPCRRLKKEKYTRSMFYTDPVAEIQERNGWAAQAAGKSFRTCPSCHETMKLVGPSFRIPGKKDDAGWRFVAEMFAGMTRQMTKGKNATQSTRINAEDGDFFHRFMPCPSNKKRWAE